MRACVREVARTGRGDGLPLVERPFVRDRVELLALHLSERVHFLLTLVRRADPVPLPLAQTVLTALRRPTTPTETSLHTRGQRRHSKTALDRTDPSYGDRPSARFDCSYIFYYNVIETREFSIIYSMKYLLFFFVVCHDRTHVEY